MNTVPRLVLLFVLFGIPADRGSITTHPDTIMQSTEQVLAAEVQKNRAPAVQYVFFNKDSVLYRYQAGYANLGDSLKFDHNTTFNMYSVTKTFTALAVMQLVAKGLVDLDKPVRQYLPGNTTLSGAITVRHLLTHTA
ncbi:MAG: beta-lactamase family protein, partial [Saprospiraceae bacterium]|nr:beta-lactamase family protein [Saprospiraceae bacterium]